MKKFLIAFFLLFLFCSKAEAVLSLDGNATASNNLSTTSSVSLTTTKTNDIIIVLSAVSNTTPIGHITGITDAAGLTWNSRKVVNFSSNDAQIEEWYAVSTGILTASNITVTYNVGSTNHRMYIFAINGANTSTPFDVNVSLPAGNTATATTSVAVTISTTNANVILFGWLRVDGAAGTGTVTRPGGFTAVAGLTSAVTDGSTSIISSTLSSVLETWSLTTSNNIGLIVDAVQAAGGGGGPTCLTTLASMGAGC